MKRTLIFLMLVAIQCVAVQAQQVELIKSFKALAFDLDAQNDEYKKMDENGNIAAIIKIPTTDTRYTFDGGALGIVATVQHTAETWVYVPPGLMKITLAHPIFGMQRNYFFDIEIEAARVYEMELYPRKVTEIAQADAGGQYVILTTDPKVAGVKLGDGAVDYVTDGYFEKFMPYGSHSLEVSAAMYETFKGEIVVSGEKINKTIHLKPQFAELIITSNVTAEVFIDDVKKGTTPYSLDRLPFGTYSMMVHAENHIAERFSMTISEAKSYSRDVQLTKNTAIINITSPMNGAEIYVGNRYYGTTPHRVELPAGQHIIELRKAGHRTSQQTITVVRGEAQTMPIDAPQPKYGKLNISASERAVEVWVDGKPLGTTPNIFANILEGERKVELKKDGFEVWGQTVKVKEGQVETLRGEMEVWKPRFATKEFNIQGVKFTMVAVEGGTFTMGCTSEQGRNCDDDEKPSHRVTLSNYYIGETEVTQELWQAVMGNNLSYYTGNRNPVESVSWDDCQEFVSELNRLLSGQLPEGYRFTLPTEAQWEYVARGGNKSRGYKYSGSDRINKVAWYWINSNGKTHPVGTKTANELGIYDMSGNVREWCADWSGDYSSASQTDPRGPSKGSYRVIRGGSWGSRAKRCRVAYRLSGGPSDRYYDLGFRVALSQ